MQCACIVIVVVIHVGAVHSCHWYSPFFIYPAVIIYPLSSLKLVPNNQLEYIIEKSAFDTFASVQRPL